MITAPTVRLDVERDRDALTETVAKLRPRLLVLDPFVRLHRIDENLSGEVAPLLAYLRELQHRYHVAVVLVHHARKGGARMRAGQALRGSSERSRSSTSAFTGFARADDGIRANTPRRTSEASTTVA